MTISSFEALGVRFELSSVEEIANISAPWPKMGWFAQSLYCQTQTLCCVVLGLGF